MSIFCDARAIGTARPGRKAPRLRGETGNRAKARRGAAAIMWRPERDQ